LSEWMRYNISQNLLSCASYWGR